MKYSYRALFAVLGLALIMLASIVPVIYSFVVGRVRRLQ